MAGSHQVRQHLCQIHAHQPLFRTFPRTPQNTPPPKHQTNKEGMAIPAFKGSQHPLQDANEESKFRGDRSQRPAGRRCPRAWLQAGSPGAPSEASTPGSSPASCRRRPGTGTAGRLTAKSGELPEGSMETQPRNQLKSPEIN